jgi:hypothetical protein
MNLKQENVVIIKINLLWQKKKPVNKKNEKIPDTFQLSLIINFNTENFIIHELSYDRIGILSKLYLYIYSLNTFKQIDIIKMQLPKNITFKLFGEEKHFENDTKKDFLELYNNDIVIWSRNLILFYKLTNKGYEYYQNIKSNYLVNSIYELKNKNLVTCGSFGLNIYSKEKNKYNLIEEHPLEGEVINIIEKNENSLIIIKKSNNRYNTKFILTLYNTEDEEETLKYDKTEFCNESPKFAMKNNYFVFNFNNECIILDKSKLSLKNNFKDVNFYGDFFGDLILIKDDKNKIIKIGEYKDGKIKFCKSFPFYVDNIIKLSNGNLIGIKRNQIIIINCIRN